MTPMTELPDRPFVYRRGLFWVAEYATPYVKPIGSFGDWREVIGLDRKRFLFRKRAEAYIEARLTAYDNEPVPQEEGTR